MQIFIASKIAIQIKGNLIYLDELITFTYYINFIICNAAYNFTYMRNKNNSSKELSIIINIIC